MFISKTPSPKFLRKMYFSFRGISPTVAMIDPNLLNTDERKLRSYIMNRRIAVRLAYP